MTNDERALFNENSNKTGILLQTGYSFRNKEYDTFASQGMITYLEIIVEKGKLYDTKYKAYYGDIPFCLQIINNSYGEPWGIDFGCPDDKLVKEKREKGSFNEFHSPTYIYDNKYLIEKGSSGRKKSDCFSIKISLTNRALRSFVIYGNSSEVISEIDNRTFNPSVHTLKNSDELFDIISPKGNNLYKVAGSKDPELRKFYNNFQIVGDTKRIGIIWFYPEWTSEQIENNGKGAVERVIAVTLKDDCYAHLSVYKGIILELKFFDDLLDVDHEERNLDVILPKLFANKKVKRIKYMRFRKDNLRITAEIETAYGKRYLDIVKYAGNKPLTYEVYLHGIKPDNFENDTIWKILTQNNKLWEK